MSRLSRFASTSRALVMSAAALATGLTFIAPAAGDVIYQTNTPFGGFFGLTGFDVFTEQSVALRFTPAADFTLDVVKVWFMNNDDTGGHPTVTLTLRTDDPKAGSIPADVILEQWTFQVSTVGWDPVLEVVTSTLHPVLHAGVNYWIMAQSNSGPFIDGVWCWAANDSGMMSICNGNPCEWTPAGESAVAAGIIEGTPVPLNCPADTNDDQVVDVNDLLAVVTTWGPCPLCPATPCAADVAPAPAGNCAVDVNDLLAVITTWGACP